MKYNQKIILQLVVYCVVLALTASAEATETISGVVRDSSGTPISDAFVTVNNNTVQVGTDGAYSFNITVPSAINIWADAFGYARRIFPILNVVGSTTCDLTLFPADESCGYNWNFEIPGATNTGADGWEINSFFTGTYNRVTTENHSPGGTASMNMHPNAPDSYSVIATSIDRWLAIDSDASYWVWYYAKGNNHGLGFMRLYWYGADKTSIYRIDDSPHYTQGNEWARYIVVNNLKLPPQSAYLQIRIYQSDAASNVYLDDIKWDYFCPTVSANSIRSVKNAGDGASVSLTGKTVTAVGGNLETGVIYIEESGRCAGIRVEGVTTTVIAGNTVSVYGKAGTTAGGERKIDATTVDPTTGTALGTLGANNKALKDRMMHGLYVRAWGAVTPDTSSSYFINDGGGPIKVIGPPPGTNYTSLNAIVSYNNGVQLIAVP